MRRRKRRCRCNPADINVVDVGAAAALGGGLGYAHVKNATNAATVGAMRGLDQRAALEVSGQGLKGFELTSAALVAAGVAASLLGHLGSGSMIAAGGASMYAGGVAAGLRTVRSAIKFLPPATTT